MSGPSSADPRTVTMAVTTAPCSWLAGVPRHASGPRSGRPSGGFRRSTSSSRTWTPRRSTQRCRSCSRPAMRLLHPVHEEPWGHMVATLLSLEGLRPASRGVIAARPGQGGQIALGERGQLLVEVTRCGPPSRRLLFSNPAPGTNELRGVGTNLGPIGRSQAPAVVLWRVPSGQRKPRWSGAFVVHRQVAHAGFEPALPP
jgi:hypothetical protein